MKLGTRRSKLALAQSGMVARDLGPDVELVGIDTEGDRIVDAPLTGPLAKGFFTEALETALREGRIDLAVHSLKDLPVGDSEGLVVAAVTRRERANDVLIARPDAVVDEAFPLRPGSRVGSTSTRRQALFRHHGRGLEVLPLRGNVTTRVERLREGRFEAIVLAEAGLNRLGTEVNLRGLRVFRLGLDGWPCAPGQGALAIQCRASDSVTRARIAALHHEPTAAAVATERQWLSALGGGCTIPFGAHVDGERWSCVLALDGVVLRSGEGTSGALPWTRGTENVFDFEVIHVDP